MAARSVANTEGAITRGLRFFYRTACDPETFYEYGDDLVFSFYWMSSTSKDPKLRIKTRKMGIECARRWRRENSTVPPEPDADVVTDLIRGDLSADFFGIHDVKLKPQIRSAARDFSAHDYFWFDPTAEPPPRDVPIECDCGTINDRGTVLCVDCAGALEMMSAYEVWTVALIRSYLGERYGVTLGASYADVLKWLPAMRPYPRYEDGNTVDFIWAIYAITHIVYTLNDYSQHRLSRRWLPDEFSFLRASAHRIMEMEDTETLGEILDSLKSFGLTSQHQLVRTGMSYLLQMQNPDGSWGDVNASDIYDRYHSTLTAINGLRDYSWCTTRLSFKSLGPLLKQWNNQEH